MGVCGGLFPEVPGGVTSFRTGVVAVFLPFRDPGGVFPHEACLGGLGFFLQGASFFNSLEGLHFCVPVFVGVFLSFPTTRPGVPLKGYSVGRNFVAREGAFSALHRGSVQISAMV